MTATPDKKPLKISRNLALPIEAATETFAILGIRGSGKTTTAKVLVEELVGVGQQVIVVDPIGVWWGLKSSADGSRAGLPFVVIGGDHGDVPLTFDAGELVADLIVDENVPVVLDLSHLRKGQQVSFMAPFLERLYHRNREALHVVVDEADLLAPQRARPETARVLGAMEDLARRGRSRGLGMTVVTQRPASLHKDVLTQASVLVSHRLSSPQDRKAVEAWVAAHGTEEQKADFMDTVASLATGEGWWWSPAWLDLFSRIQTRKPRTFDSSATPKAGEKRFVPTGFAQVDLDLLRERMAGVVAKAEENDPKALHRRINDLERQLAVAQKAGTGKPEVETVEVEIEVEVVPDGLLEVLNQAVRVLEEGAADLADRQRAMADTHRDLLDAVRALPPGAARKNEVSKRKPTKPVTRPAPQPEPAPSRALPRVQANGDQAGNAVRVEGREIQIKAGARRILEMLARHHPMRMTKAQVGTLAGFAARKSGTFGAYQSALKQAGLIDVADGYFTITEAGLDFVGVVNPKPVTVEEVRERWRAALKKGARHMLDVLIDVYPNPISREDLGVAVGLTSNAGTFGAYLSSLRSNGLAEVSGQEVRASDSLFFGADVG